MIYRCSDLAIFLEEQVLNLWRKMSMSKMHPREPLDDILPVESTAVLRKSIDLLLKNKVVSPEDCNCPTLRDTRYGELQTALIGKKKEVDLPSRTQQQSNRVFYRIRPPKERVQTGANNPTSSVAGKRH